MVWYYDIQKLHRLVVIHYSDGSGVLMLLVLYNWVMKKKSFTAFIRHSERMEIVWWCDFQKLHHLKLMIVFNKVFHINVFVIQTDVYCNGPCKKKSF